MSTGFRDLVVWQRSKTLAVAGDRLIRNGPFSSDFALRDQMRRAAISVCSSIAEGDARNPINEAIQCFPVAQGSLAELSAQLEIAQEIHGIPMSSIQPSIAESETLGAMLRGLINHRRE